MKRGLLLEEMTVRQEVNYTKLLSSPARGTWVEIYEEALSGLREKVVSRTGDVG